MRAGDTTCSVSDTYTARTDRGARQDRPAAFRYVGLQLLGLHCQRWIGLISDDARRHLFGAELEVRIHLPPAESRANFISPGRDPDVENVYYWIGSNLTVSQLERRGSAERFHTEDGIAIRYTLPTDGRTLLDRILAEVAGRKPAG